MRKQSDESSTSHVVLQTGDRGFDRLLDTHDGGIRIRVSTPGSILLRGLPGSGKSTCALQIARSYIEAHKAICLYITLEEYPQVFRERLINFFESPSFPTILGSEWKQGSPETEGFIRRASEVGGMVFSRFEFQHVESPGMPSDMLEELPIDVAIDKLTDQLDNLSALTSTITRPTAAPNLLVVDSLNAFLDQSTPSGRDLPRRIISSLLCTPTVKDFFSVLVFEPGEGVQIEEYMVDVLIELGVASEPEGQRYVRVVKARDHDCSIATHDMEIKRKIGVHVFPKISLAKSPLSVGSAPHGRYPPTVRLDVSGLDEDLTASPGRRQGLTTGSGTLVLAQPETYSRLLGLRFLRAGIEQGEKVCFVAFEGDEIAISRYGEAVFGKKHFEDAFVSIPVLHRTLSQVASLVTGQICERCSGEGLKRVLIGDLRTLAEHHPGAFAEAIGYLLLLLRQHAATTLAVFTTSDPLSHLGEPLADLFENIVITRYLRSESAGKRYLTIQLRKFDGMTVQRPLRNLQIQVDDLSVRAPLGAVRNMVETPAGQLSFGKVLVTHYRGETRALDALWNDIQAWAEESFVAGDDVPKFRSFSFRKPDKKRGGKETVEEKPEATPESVLESVATGLVEPRGLVSEIVTMDEFWLQWLTSKSRLMPVKEADPEFEVERYLPLSDYPLLKQASGDNVLFGIPFYANLSVLAYDKALLKACASRANLPDLVNSATGLIARPLSWRSIFRLSREVEEAKKSIQVPKGAGSRVVAFYYDTHSDECLNCFFLELLWSAGFFDHDQGTLSPTAMADNKAATLLARWQEQFRSASSAKLESGEAQKMPRFLFARMWYTRILEYIADYPWMDLGFTTIPPLSEEDGPGVCMTGNWYLGIVRGAANPRLAAKMAEWMTSYRINAQLSRDGIALPTYADCWNADQVPIEIQSLYRDAKQRTTIRNYVWVKPALAAAARRLFLSGKKLGGEGIRSIMLSLGRELRALKETRGVS